MLIAHMPAGYIVSKIANKKTSSLYTICGLIFSVWPDLDLFYYYFFDKTGTFHHTYFTHLPFVAVISFLIMFSLTFIKGLKKHCPYYWLFYINWGVHLVCDTFTGGIAWLYPFNDMLFTIINIPPISPNWVISFIFHWSFTIEIAIVIWAVVLFSKQYITKDIY